MINIWLKNEYEKNNLQKKCIHINSTETSHFTSFISNLKYFYNTQKMLFLTLLELITILFSQHTKECSNVPL